MAEFDAWFDGLRDRMARVRLGGRLDKVQRGAVPVVMLGGGDKASQSRDIEAAKALAATLVFKE